MKIINKDFDLAHIFECGQCFRWDKIDTDSYVGVVDNRVVKIDKTDTCFMCDCDDEKFIVKYFDLERDYADIKNKLASIDKVLPDAIPSGFGIRILKQDPWETLVSFIISANNNIPRIKKIINSLCENFGTKIKDGYYSFPSAETIASLTIDDLAVIRSGFRAKYIIDAAQKVVNGTINLDSVYTMPTSSAREYLKQIKGVGDKVADCILLFAYQKFDVFPKDVWIKKVLHDLYGVEDKDFDKFVLSHFGELAGFAQQYLFYYMRG